jgi:transposase
MAATIEDASSFAGPREFAAFLGLTPKQNSSGGKRRCQTKFYTACLGAGTRSTSLILLMNRRRARRDSKPKIAYTYLP